MVARRRQEIGRCFLARWRLPHDSRDRIRMVGFGALHKVQLDIPSNRIGRVGVRLRPVGVNDVNLGYVSQDQTTLEKGILYVVMIVLQIATQGDFPA